MSGDKEEVMVPEGVIRGIEGIANGEFASKEDLIEAVKETGESEDD